MDVRDVAKANVIALEKEAAANERIVVSSSSVANQEFIESAKRAATSLGITGVQTGIPNYDPAKAKLHSRFSEVKRDRILGIDMIPLDDSVRDTIANFKERGWVHA